MATTACRSLADASGCEKTQTPNFKTDASAYENTQASGLGYLGDLPSKGRELDFDVFPVCTRKNGGHVPTHRARF